MSLEYFQRLHPKEGKFPAKRSNLRRKANKQTEGRPPSQAASRNAIAACSDPESLNALLRKRGQAIALSREEATLLRDFALSPSDAARSAWLVVFFCVFPCLSVGFVWIGKF